MGQPHAASRMRTGLTCLEGELSCKGKLHRFEDVLSEQLPCSVFHIIQGNSVLPVDDRSDYAFPWQQRITASEDALNLVFLCKMKTNLEGKVLLTSELEVRMRRTLL